MIKLVLIVKYCFSSTLTVNNFLLSFSILYPLLVSVPALSVVKYCISSKLHQIHCSLVVQLVLIVKYCISSKLHQIQYSFSDQASTIVTYCISSKLHQIQYSFSDQASTSCRILTVNNFFLSFSNISTAC